MTPPRLIGITKCLDGEMTPEQFIAYMARVSSPQNQDKHQTATRLITYLLDHSHWSPFDMVDMILEIHTSRAIMAQILRHWSFRFQEFSQRYSEVDDTYEHVTIREKHEEGNRQGSGETSEELTGFARSSCAASLRVYQTLLKMGAAPETARMILPLATQTRAYIKGSVRSWITYFWQRLDSHAQKEHRDLALQMFEIFSEQVPTIADIIRTHRPVMAPCES